MQIRTVTIKDLDQLARLFDAYRVFYKQESDLIAAKLFLSKRIVGNQSIILMALNKDKTALGFMQLFPSYSSVALKPVYILNDLFVAQKGRNKGVGTALLDAAKELARKHGARGLLLETDQDNPAQKLYEKNGWTKDTALHYYWEVPHKINSD